MPELPEVETIVRGLKPRVEGRRIERVELRLPKQVRGMDAAAFCRLVGGQVVRRISRRGKYLLMFLDRHVLLGHLGMSGQLTYWDRTRKDTPGFVAHPVTGLQRTPGQHAPDAHTHLLFHLEGGDRVQYRDIRQFGHWRLLEPGQLEGFKPLARLGLEPLGPDWRFDAFRRAFRARRGMVKAALLSQSPVAGLGNIYADEALHLSGVHPRSRIERLREKDLRALFDAIPRVLRKGIRNRGTTLMDFRGAHGEKGRNQESLRVYGRHGANCLACGAALRKILVSQRTTVFCPRCQPKR